MRRLGLVILMGMFLTAGCQGAAVEVDYYETFQFIPIVEEVLPADESLDVATSSTVEIIFAVPVDRISAEGLFTLTILNDTADMSNVASRSATSTVIEGTFTWPDPATMVFIPSMPLACGKTYLVSLVGNLRLSEDVQPDSDGKSIFVSVYKNFTTLPCDDEKISITSIYPLNGAIDVDINTTVELSLSNAVNPEDIELLLVGNSSEVDGSITWNDSYTSLTFIPLYPLAFNSRYTLTVGGSALDRTYESFFTTRPDVEHPAVSRVTPEDGTTDVALDAVVYIKFTMAMDTLSTEGAFSLTTEEDAVVAGTFSWDQGYSRLIFASDTPLDYDTIYRVRVTTAATNPEGTPLDETFTSSFTTTADVFPIVFRISPTSGATGIPTDTAIEMTFNVAMDTDSVKDAFSLVQRQGGVAVAGTFAWSEGDTVICFMPDAVLTNNRLYDITVTTDAQDTEGNPLEEDFTSDFKTVH